MHGLKPLQSTKRSEPKALADFSTVPEDPIAAKAQGKFIGLE